MPTEQNQATVLAVYSGFNTQDWTGLLDLVTEDFELEDVALGVSWHGKEGWREWLAAWAVSMPDAMTRVELDHCPRRSDRHRAHRRRNAYRPLANTGGNHPGDGQDAATALRRGVRNARWQDQDHARLLGYGDVDAAAWTHVNRTTDLELKSLGRASTILVDLSFNKR